MGQEPSEYREIEGLEVPSEKLHEISFPKIRCDVHGVHEAVMQNTYQGKVVGTFCFFCWNDFIIKNLKSYEVLDEKTT